MTRQMKEYGSHRPLKGDLRTSWMHSPALKLRCTAHVGWISATSRARKGSIPATHSPELAIGRKVLKGVDEEVVLLHDGRHCHNVECASARQSRSRFEGRRTLRSHALEDVLRDSLVWTVLFASLDEVDVLVRSLGALIEAWHAAEG